ncbi:MAG TPA: tetratricopeptide repeat protein [Pseudonocardia sp.]|nr:tetratricopeptide repeat protein [Pseudonocardia sp.]
MAWWSREGRGRGGNHHTPEDLAELADGNADGARLCTAGRASDAVARFEDALAGCLGRLGPDHPATLTVGGNLGAACTSAGQWRRGLELMAGNLSDRVRVFGDDDPRTLTAADALASAYRLAGEVDEALALSGRVTAERRRLLGPAHPDTLVSRMGMALARAAAGDVASAVTLLEAALGDAEQAHHGARHEHTIALRGNVAACLASLGHTDEAAAGFRRAAADSAALLGRDHPETVALREELANVHLPSRFAVTDAIPA